MSWLAEQGVMASAVSGPADGGVGEYPDYAQWVIQEVKPKRTMEPRCLLSLGRSFRLLLDRTRVLDMALRRRHDGEIRTGQRVARTQCCGSRLPRRKAQILIAIRRFAVGRSNLAAPADGEYGGPHSIGLITPDGHEQRIRCMRPAAESHCNRRTLAARRIQKLSIVKGP
jgi:hypothetical protein